MKTLKQIVGENLIALRKAKHLTQYELAEKMHYSDKSISKWENGDTLPELETLNELCKFYGVTLDYLTHDVHENKSEYVLTDKKDTINSIVIISLIDSIIWMIATIIFVYGILRHQANWVVFVYSVPITCIVTSFLYRKRFRPSRLAFFIIWTIFTWSFLASIFCGFLTSERNIILWPIFLLGVPAEVSLGLWSFIKNSKKSRI